jgi:hypothetical protein
LISLVDFSLLCPRVANKLVTFILVKSECPLLVFHEIKCHFSDLIARLRDHSVRRPDPPGGDISITNAANSCDLTEAALRLMHVRAAESPA